MGWKEEVKGDEAWGEEAVEKTVADTGKEVAGEAETMEETLKEERRKAVVDMEGRTERKLPVSCCRSHIEPKPALPRAMTIRKGAKRYEVRRVVVVVAIGGARAAIAAASCMIDEGTL